MEEFKYCTEKEVKNLKCRLKMISLIKNKTLYKWVFEKVCKSKLELLMEKEIDGRLNEGLEEMLNDFVEYKDTRDFGVPILKYKPIKGSREELLEPKNVTFNKMNISYK